jgi:hypothetical protein
LPPEAGEIAAHDVAIVIAVTIHLFGFDRERPHCTTYL